MALEFDSLELVPETIRDGFVEHDGKFVPKEVVELHKAKKASFDKAFSVEARLKEQLEQLEQYKKSESEREVKIREEMEVKLRKEGKVDELLKLEKEKFDNSRKSLEEQLKGWEEKYTGLQTGIVEKEKDSLAHKIASQYAPKAMIEGVAELLKSRRMKVVDGQVSLTNAGGEALDIKDIAQVLQNLESDPFFKPYAAAPDSRGGDGKGGSHDSGTKTITRAAFMKLSPHEQKEKIRAGFKPID